MRPMREKITMELEATVSEDFTPRTIVFIILAMVMSNGNQWNSASPKYYRALGTPKG